MKVFQQKEVLLLGWMMPFDHLTHLSYELVISSGVHFNIIQSERKTGRKRKSPFLFYTVLHNFVNGRKFHEKKMIRKGFN